MPFEKGHDFGKGRPAGSKNIKTAQWDNIGDYLVEEGSLKYLEHMKSLAVSDPEKYTEAYMKILEYFKPKRAREDGKGNPDLGIGAYLNEEHKQKAKEAIGKFLGT